MKFLLDTHCHSVASGHAYSTIQENALQAAHLGYELIAITDHGPKMPDGPHMYYFHNLRALPQSMFGVEILKGAEANIIDIEGNIDFPEEVLTQLDLVIASCHPPCIAFGTKEENTRTFLNTMKNPYIHIIGHPGDPRYPIDVKAFVYGAKQTDTLIEINNASLKPDSFRAGSKEYILQILEECKEQKVAITLGSDAHVSFAVGDYAYAEPLLREVQIPEELVANTSVKRLKALLSRKQAKAQK